MRVRLLACLTATAVAGSAAFYATHGTPPLSRHVVHARYTTTDVLQYLLLSAGPVVADHPALGQPAIRTTPQLAATKARAAVESMTRCIDRIDASAGPALTAAFNAADPQRLDTALRRFDAAANRWLTAPYKQDAPCPPPPPPPNTVPANPGSGPVEVNGWLHVDYVFESYDTVAGALTLLQVGALVIGLLTVFALVVFVALVLVPAFIWYEFERAPTDLDRQTEIAKIVQALRS
jgi:hypothetical protein